MKIKKTPLYIFVLIFCSLFLTGCTNNDSEENDFEVESRVVKDSANQENSEEKNYILEGYPLDVVPFYEMDQISSMHFFVNDDPQAYRSYFDDEVNYYNVVYRSSASESDFFKYYENLMSDVETKTDSILNGQIGKYKISAYSHGGVERYLQVYLPSNEYSKQNKYFDTYPDLVEIGDGWTEHESSYGRINQLGGEKTYTRYFNLSEDDIQKFYEIYTTKYSEKDNFENDKEDRVLKWTEDDYTITLSFHQNHKRIYLSMKGEL